MASLFKELKKAFVPSKRGKKDPFTALTDALWDHDSTLTAAEKKLRKRGSCLPPEKPLR